MCIALLSGILFELNLCRLINILFKRLGFEILLFLNYLNILPFQPYPYNCGVVLETCLKSLAPPPPPRPMQSSLPPEPLRPLPPKLPKTLLN